MSAAYKNTHQLTHIMTEFQRSHYEQVKYNIMQIFFLQRFSPAHVLTSVSSCLQLSQCFRKVPSGGRWPVEGTALPLWRWCARPKGFLALTSPGRRTVPGWTSPTPGDRGCNYFLYGAVISTVNCVSAAGKGLRGSESSLSD